ncbi:MAG: hypothetical protein CMJ18_03215 [Phycisphaeraceae bacterium]|nr:hypothetical protein [Phycisphaeraceae bacterium]
MSRIFDIDDFAMASSGSVVRMAQWEHEAHPFYADFGQLALAVDAITTRAPLHLSGKSGGGKSHFLNALLFGPPENFEKVRDSLDLPKWDRIACHRIFISSFEAPSEIWYRTVVKEFSTHDQPQRMLEVLEEAAADRETLHVVWIVESGRGITATVQGGLLEIVGQDTIRDPQGKQFDARNVAFVTDSNHQANESGDFAIHELDQAYGRRWTRRLTFAGLDPEQEARVLRELAADSTEEQVGQVVALAIAIRRKHGENALESVLPPTIDAELDLLGCLRRLPVDSRQTVFNTLLGHCQDQERDEAESIFAEAFGVKVDTDSAAAKAVGVL